MWSKQQTNNVVPVGCEFFATTVYSTQSDSFSSYFLTRTITSESTSLQFCWNEYLSMHTNKMNKYFITKFVVDLWIIEFFRCLCCICSRWTTLRNCLNVATHGEFCVKLRDRKFPLHRVFLGGVKSKFITLNPRISCNGTYFCSNKHF